MIKNSFEKGPENWCTYDYHASVIASGPSIMILTTWARNGGVNNGSYVWTDHTRWSADVPEKPESILALIYYREWENADPIDLREAEVSAYLRGDGLDLGGAICDFWINIPGQRWHYSGHPLTISDGKWAPEPNRITLHNDEKLWHHSWAGRPPKPKSLDECLRQVHSYGFAFVGLSMEVSGRLSMAQFEIKPARSS
ncbi:MAG: hypothetical protein EXR62_00825 [Chloroflexi bacterium]|nr:hypothetical protein [Chloroflexota bacterium]